MNSESLRYYWTGFCNNSYPDEFACVPLKILNDCKSNNITNYYVHFVSSNILDLTGKLHSCFKSFTERCKQGCGYCWSPYDEDMRGNGFYFSQSSYEHFNREWTVIARTAESMSHHTMVTVEGVAKSIIYQCEKLADNDDSKLYWGLGIGAFILLWGGWAAYCKYRDYQSQHLLDHLKKPIELDDNIELKEIDS